MELGAKLRVVAALAASSLCACASFGTFIGQEGGQVQFGSDAEQNMSKGEDAMTSKNYADAALYFEHVKTKYPFIELSKLAELRLADADFEREHFTEARERYQNFVRLHPTHDRIDYAAFQAALTHYKEIPSDFFLLPPAYEKDQMEVRNAQNAMSEFTRNHPDSKFMTEAKKVIDETRLRLAEHELYAADFYARRERWPAVISRLTKVTKSFSGIGLDERAYFELSDAYLKLQQGAKAREALQQYAEKFPNTPGAERALARIAQLPASPSPAMAPDAGT